MQTRKEKKERESDNKNLSDRIADLEKDKLDLRRVMLFRALAKTQFVCGVPGGPFLMSSQQSRLLLAIIAGTRE